MPKLSLLLLALMMFPGCNLAFRSTPTPIPTMAMPVETGKRTDTLVVFLRGRGGSMADFEKEGMVAAMRDAGVKADAIAVDSHLGYYYRRTVITRLQADVLQPARKQGYRRIVLVGVSLGGLGALLNERDAPGTVDALVLLSPNLGDDRKLFERIALAGGPVKWATGRDTRAGSIFEQLWTFIGTKSAALPPTWLLYGESDPYAGGHRLFAPLLPPKHVRTIAGGHDWPVWRALWRDVCEQSDLFAAERTK